MKQGLSIILLIAISICTLFAQAGYIFSAPEVKANLLHPVIDIYTGETAIIELEYIIPQGYHQTMQEDYFCIEIEEQSGISDGATLYPDGLVADDMELLNYHGTIVLGKEVHIAKGLTEGVREVKIKFYYQLCKDEGGICLMPEEMELSVTLYILRGKCSPSVGGDDNRPD